jgi:phosphoribosyl 1,2-cyclic phosphodiesterase
MADDAGRLVFLGTGAAGGTPGRGRSRRRESSLLIDADVGILLDVSRDFEEQSARVGRLDTVLLTHAHRDAAGGIPALRRWLGRGPPVRVLASPTTLARLRERYARLDHCDMVATMPGAARRVGSWTVEALGVPHARDRRVPTCAWRLKRGVTSIVYASDVARLTPALQRFARGATVLVADGATWRRTIFTHLRIDRDVPTMCKWDVERILLTQIGRSAPPHAVLARAVTHLCARALPAYDGLEEPL